jgi:hypothetical protein
VKFPVEIPVTTPLPSTVALAVLLDDQVPPGVAAVSAVEESAQIPDAPVIVAEGEGLTVKLTGSDTTEHPDLETTTSKTDPLIEVVGFAIV